MNEFNIDYTSVPSGTQPQVPRTSCDRAQTLGPSPRALGHSCTRFQGLRPSNSDPQSLRSLTSLSSSPAPRILVIRPLSLDPDPDPRALTIRTTESQNLKSSISNPHILNLRPSGPQPHLLSVSDPCLQTLTTSSP